MAEVTIRQLPNDGVDKLFQISRGEVLGVLRINKDTIIWSPDLFAKLKISKKTAVNYYNNYHE